MCPINGSKVFPSDLWSLVPVGDFLRQILGFPAACLPPFILASRNLSENFSLRGIFTKRETKVNAFDFYFPQVRRYIIAIGIDRRHQWDYSEGVIIVVAISVN